MKKGGKNMVGVSPVQKVSPSTLTYPGVVFPYYRYS